MPAALGTRRLWLNLLLSVALVSISGRPPRGVVVAAAPVPQRTAADGLPNGIPWSEIGVRAEASYNGDGLSISATPDGAVLQNVFHMLEARLTDQGLSLTSTSEKLKVTPDGHEQTPLRVIAAAIGRDGGVLDGLAPTGTVVVEPRLSRFVRPLVTEEYSVSANGIRHDFVIGERPKGTGRLQLAVDVEGARLEAGTEREVRLVLGASGRVLTYGGLHVEDDRGVTLEARMTVTSASRLTVTVDDAEARYPIRIDPTYGDERWSAISGSPNGLVFAMAVSASGTLYIGGEFTEVGGVRADRVAKWTGTGWETLGTHTPGLVNPSVCDGLEPHLAWEWAGVNSTVTSLTISGGDVYVGGTFNQAGRACARRVAKWDGQAWSGIDSGANIGSVSKVAWAGSLYVAGNLLIDGVVATIARYDGAWSIPDSGVNGLVVALAASGDDLYVGGSFTTAGGAPANNVARLSGSGWSALGSGVSGPVWALAASGGEVYASIRPACCLSTGEVVKWDGSTWTALGEQLDAPPEAMAIVGPDLYVAGAFIRSVSGTSLNRIARWDGARWLPLGSGLDPSVHAMAAFGTRVYVGGGFTTAGGMPAIHLAQWDGSPFPLPRITDIVPASGTQGTTISAAIVGGDLTGATAVAFSGAGVTAAIENGGTATTIPITVTIAADAVIGLRSVTVTSVAGTSVPFAGFSVVNTPPTASFSFAPDPTSVGEITTFDASASRDTDGVIVRYRWDFGDGAIVDSGANAVQNHTYSTDGDRIVTLTVEDDDGAVGQTQRLVRVQRAQGQWVQQGPPGGPVSGVVVHPTNPSIVYIGLFGRGVYRSANGGQTWSPVNAGLTDLNVSQLVISPSAPATLFAVTELGIFRTINGGVSWSAAANVGPGGAGALVIHPENSSTLYAYGGRGLYRTFDAGQTWALATTGLTDGDLERIQCMAIDPVTPTTVYACGRGRFFRSTDGGDHWARIDTSGFFRGQTMVVDPVTPTTLYHASLEVTFGGVHRSLDGGVTWTPLLATPVSSVALDPITPSRIYACTHFGGIYKTTDGGAVWNSANAGLMPVGCGVLVVHPLVPTTVYATGGDGLVRSDNAAASWSAAMGGLAFRHVAGLVADPVIPSTVYALTGALMRSRDMGATWTTLTSFGVSNVAVHPVNPSILYAATTGWDVLRTIDGGVSWTVLVTGIPFGATVYALAIDPLAPSTVYAGTSAGVYRSTNGGDSWTPANAGLPGGVDSLTIDPLTSSTVFATGAPVAGGLNLFRTRDGGGTWTPVGAGFPAGDFVRTLAIDPVTPSSLYAGTYAHGVYRTTNGGDTWVPANAGLPPNPVTSVVIDPASPATIYAAAFRYHDGFQERPGAGVFRSTNSGATWSPMNAGLADLSVRLAIEPRSPSVLYAGTESSSVFRWQPDGIRRLAVTNPGSGSGTVTSVPAGIACGEDCLEEYSTGTVVTLSQTAIPPSTFVSFGGDADCLDGVVTLSDNRTCTATFNLPAAPTVTAHPSNQTVRAGGTAIFTAAASGNPAPAVQWQASTNNGSTWNSAIGATSATYTFTATAADHGKWLRAVFTNSGGQVASSAAAVTVRSVSGSDFNGDATTDLAIYRPAGGMWLVRNQPSVQLGQLGDVPAPGDYNGDGTTDIAVFRPSTAQWLVRNQPTVQFGAPGDVPVPGDYNGDGTTDLAVYRPLTGQWLVRNQFTIQFGGAGYIPIAGDFNGDGSDDIAVFQPKTGAWSVRNQFNVQYGEPGDIPVPGDYNGNGSDDVAVYRPGTGQWLVRNQFVVSYGSPGDRPMPRDYNGDGTTDIAVHRRATGQWFARNQFIIQFGEPADIPAPRGPSLARAVGGDFDGNGNTDVSVYRPSTGQWFVRNKFAVQFGDPTDKAVPADYDGDGIIDVAVYRPSTGQWFARNQFAVQFGDPTDLPVPGDYNGDGVHDVAVFRPSTGTWYVRNVLAFQFGDNGDLPVPGDYNGDGITDLAVYRPSTRQWFVRNILAVQFGDVNDLPVPGDYNGDGVMDVAVYRPSTGQWFVRNILALQFGDATDTPVPGDYDGDGRTDLAVLRQSTGQWFVRNLLALRFGDPTDKPIVRIGGTQ